MLSRRQAVQVPPSGLPEGLLAAVQLAITLPVPPDGQAIQMQLLLQVLRG